MYYDTYVHKKCTERGEYMKRLIAEMEDELHIAVKMEALKRGISVKQFVIETIEKELGKEEIADAGSSKCK